MSSIPGDTFHSDAQMSSVLGETQYITPRNQNLTGSEVLAGHSSAYCASCSSSFRLLFTSTTIGNSSGVFGTGFDYYAPDDAAYGPQIVLSVIFGDNSTRDIPLPFSPPYAGGSAQTLFFAITSNLGIQSINFGGPGGTSTNSLIALTDLTIGAPPVPLPASGWLLASALSGCSLFARRRVGEWRQFSRKVFGLVGGQHLPQLHERAHDIDANLDGAGCSRRWQP